MKAKATEKYSKREVPKGVVTFSRRGCNPLKVEQPVDFATVRQPAKDSQSSAEPSGSALRGAPTDPYEFHTSDDDDEPVQPHQQSGELAMDLVPTSGHPALPLPPPPATMKQDAQLGTFTQGSVDAGSVCVHTWQQEHSQAGLVSSAELVARRARGSTAVASRSASGNRPPLPAPRAPQAVSQHDPDFLQQLVATQEKVGAAWSSSDDGQSDDEEASGSEDCGEREAGNNSNLLPDSGQGESNGVAAPFRAGLSRRAMLGAGPAAPPAKPLGPSNKPCTGADPQPLSGGARGASTDGGGAMPIHQQQKGVPAAQRVCDQGLCDATRKRKMPQATEVTVLVLSPGNCTRSICAACPVPKYDSSVRAQAGWHVHAGRCHRACSSAGMHGQRASPAPAVPR